MNNSFLFTFDFAYSMNREQRCWPRILQDKTFVRRLLLLTYLIFNTDAWSVKQEGQVFWNKDHHGSVCFSHSAMCEGSRSSETIAEHDSSCFKVKHTLEWIIHWKNNLSHYISTVFFNFSAAISFLTQHQYKMHGFCECFVIY